MYLRILAVLAIALTTATCRQTEKADPLNRDWPIYGGNKAGNRYSDLDQINKNNVDSLKVAWIYDTGDNDGSTGWTRMVECQPIVVGGILYGTTATMKLFAVDGATGRDLWMFDPFDQPGKRPVFHPIRGVAYWEDGDDKRILYGAGPTLYAIDATTGKKVPTFGEDGGTSLYQGLDDSTATGRDPSKLLVDLTTPGVVYRDLLIIGSRVSEGGDAAPGYIRAFNIRTGELVWAFRTIPLPGEAGHETWPSDAYKRMGGANNWSGLVLDEKRGIVYAGTGSPSVDFYGGDREGQNLFANSVLALDAKTGKRIWHFQTVHHDLWDLDIPTPPNLMTVTHNGRKVDAVAQATKDGYVFLFNRETGEPLFPIEEVPVEGTYALPGERPWPTQPRPTKPRPFAMQVLTEDSLTNRTLEARAYVLDRFRNSRYEGRYTNPSMEGSLFFAFGGGAEWGGNAATPDGILYQNSNNMLWWLQMRENPNYGQATTGQSAGQALFNTNCSTCHSISKEGANNSASQGIPNLRNVGERLTRTQISTLVETGSGRMPSFQHLERKERDAIIDYLLQADKPDITRDFHAGPADLVNTGADFPYIPPFLNNGNIQFRDQENYPAIKPPWGLLNAIDMNTGEYLWQVPLGEYPQLSEKGVPPTGTENHGGPVVTAGGLVFIAATYDEKIRAFDRDTGEVLWEHQLPAGGFATPITYMINGKQYIAIAAGGARYGLKSSGTYVAFALP